MITIFGAHNDGCATFVFQLAKLGYYINIVTEYTDSVKNLQCYGFPGQITISRGKLSDYTFLKSIIASSNYVVNFLELDNFFNSKNIKISNAVFSKLIAEYCEKYKVKKYINCQSLRNDNAQQDISSKNFYNITCSMIISRTSQYISYIQELKNFPFILVPKSSIGKQLYYLCDSELSTLICNIIQDEYAQYNNAILITNTKSIALIEFFKFFTRNNMQFIYIPNSIARFKILLASILPFEWLKCISTPLITPDQYQSIPDSKFLQLHRCNIDIATHFKDINCDNLSKCQPY